MYFTAFVRIFVMICFTRISSPKSRFGVLLSKSSFSSRSFASARVLTIFTRSFNTDESSYSTGTISILSASILEKSSISFIRPRSVSPAVLMLAEYSRIFSSLHSRRIISFMPSTAFIGVRISCDMFERNADFAWLSAIAFSV